MEKVGKDVLGSKVALQSSTKKSFTQSTKYNDETLKKQILSVLQTSNRPLIIAEVASLTGLSPYAAKTILVELEAEGLLEHYFVGRYMFFKLKHKGK